MKIFTNRTIRNLFLAVTAVMAGFFVLSQIVVIYFYHEFSLPLCLIFAAAFLCVTVLLYIYFYRQNQVMEKAVSEIDAFLAGDKDARIDCDREGELFKLFHSVNTLACVLNAHAENELQSREFLKDTISDISHQLKTPLAALNIYNGLLMDESPENPAVREFAELSEQELDRIDVLVRNLLTITRLDAGAIVLERSWENLAELLWEVRLHFAYRAKKEEKEILLSGPEELTLFCDRDWIMEAINNLVKNALDHTTAGCTVSIEWKHSADLTQIAIKDDGVGIHPEDIHHIFKRFYRSRFSSDTRGIGLGLPLAKAVIEAHDGTITADSSLGQGAVFLITFLNATKL